MKYYLTVGVVAVLTAMTFVGSVMVQVAVLLALMCLGVLVEMIRMLKRPMSDEQSLKLFNLLWVIAMAMLVITLSVPYVSTKIIGALALISLSSLICAMHLRWSQSREIGLDDQESKVGKEADRYFESK